MKNENLWAPWRLDYVAGGPQKPTQTERELKWLPGADKNCFICRAQADDADRENLVIGRTPHSIVIANRFPYNNGHLLIAPRAHKARLDELTPDEQLDAMQVITRMTGVIEGLMKPDGFNVGLNLGQAAGAGLPGHLHWHVVPRWRGDTNFMPATAGIRVMPQSLEALWELLHDALKES